MIPLELGAWNVQFIQKHLDRHNPSFVKHLIDLVETLGTVQGFAQDAHGSVLSHNGGIVPRATRRRKMVARRLRYKQDRQ